MIAVTALFELSIDRKLSLRARDSSKNGFDFYGGETKAWTPGQQTMSDAIMVEASTVRISHLKLTVCDFGSRSYPRAARFRSTCGFE